MEPTPDEKSSGGAPWLRDFNENIYMQVRQFASSHQQNFSSKHRKQASSLSANSDNTSPRNQFKSKTPQSIINFRTRSC